MAEFRMPSLGADMDEGILLEWLVKPGQLVHRGDVVAVVETPKSAVEIESFDDGPVQELLVEEGRTVPVGQVLAIIGDEATHEAAAPVPVQPERQEPAPQEAAPQESVPLTDGHDRARSTTPGHRERAGPGRAPSPVLRHRAQQLGVDLGSITGSGADGAVTRRDVERAASPRGPRPRATPLARRLADEEKIDLGKVAASGVGGVIRADDVRAAVSARTAKPTSAAEPVSPVPPVRDMRGSIAALMTRANRDIPHYYVSATVDMHEALAWMHARNRRVDVPDRLVPAALMVAATARAAHRVPELNGHWIDGQFRPAEEVTLGLIVSLRQGGLLVPTIPHADGLTVAETMGRVRELTRRARSGRLRGSELSMPSITMSNLGEQGVESLLGVIYPPQVALVGFGAIGDRPWSIGGLLGVRPLVTVTLAGDHRATDGATGARFLKTIDGLLQKPEEL